MPTRNTLTMPSVAPSPTATVALRQEERDQLINELGSLLSREAIDKKRMGEILLQLTETYNVTMESLAKRFHCKRTVLVDMKNTVKEANKSGVQIDPLVPFSIYENAAKGKNIVPMAEAVPILMKGGSVPLQQGQPKVFKMFTDRQAAKVALKMHAKAKAEAKAVAAAPLLLARGRHVLNRCHHGPFMAVVGKLPAGVVKLAWFDPPYGQFRRNRDGSYPVADSVSRADVDSNGAVEALQVAVEPWAELRPKMAPGGVCVLWQAGTGPLRPEIQAAMRAAGWVSPMPVVWDKKKMQMCDPSWPWVTAIEIAYVTWIKGEQPRNHTVSSFRPNIIQCNTVQHSAENGADHHVYEKPEELCKVFVERHTRPGELVFDMCGCSGSMSIVANRFGRQWIYSESNKKNFEWGAKRISESVHDKRIG